MVIAPSGAGIMPAGGGGTGIPPLKFGGGGGGGGAPQGDVVDCGNGGGGGGGGGAGADESVFVEPPSPFIRILAAGNVAELTGLFPSKQHNTP